MVVLWIWIRTKGLNGTAFVVHALDGVVVVVQFGAGLGVLPCELESQLDVLRADDVQPDALPQGGRGVIFESLVHYVPREAVVVVVSRLVLDVVLHDLDELRLGPVPAR